MKCRDKSINDTHTFNQKYQIVHHFKSVSGPFCGSTLPPTIEPKGSRLVMRFQTDLLTEGKGFRAYWTTDPSLPAPTEPPVLPEPWNNITIGAVFIQSPKCFECKNQLLFTAFLNIWKDYNVSLTLQFAGLVGPFCLAAVEWQSRTGKGIEFPVASRYRSEKYIQVKWNRQMPQGRHLKNPVWRSMEALRMDMWCTHVTLAFYFSLFLLHHSVAKNSRNTKVLKLFVCFFHLFFPPKPSCAVKRGDDDSGRWEVTVSESIALSFLSKLSDPNSSASDRLRSWLWQNELNWLL